MPWFLVDVSVLQEPCENLNISTSTYGMSMYSKGLNDKHWKVEHISLPLSTYHGLMKPKAESHRCLDRYL